MRQSTFDNQGDSMEVQCPMTIEELILLTLNERVEVCAVIDRNPAATKRNIVRSFGLGDLGIGEAFAAIDQMVADGLIDRRTILSPADEESNILSYPSVREYSFTLPQ